VKNVSELIHHTQTNKMKDEANPTDHYGASLFSLIIKINDTIFLVEAFAVYFRNATMMDEF
jgi:hypothetical protein